MPKVNLILKATACLHTDLSCKLQESAFAGIHHDDKMTEYYNLLCQ